MNSYMLYHDNKCMKDSKAESFVFTIFMWLTVLMFMTFGLLSFNSLYEHIIGERSLFLFVFDIQVSLILFLLLRFLFKVKFKK